MGSVSLTLLTLTCRTWSTWYLKCGTHSLSDMCAPHRPPQTLRHTNTHRHSRIYRINLHKHLLWSPIMPRSFRVFCYSQSRFSSSPTSPVPHFPIHPYSLPSSLPPTPTTTIISSLLPPLYPVGHVFCCFSAKHGALPLPRLIDHQFSSNLDQVSW